MTNRDVMKAFANREKARTRNLHATNEQTLVNYTTPIAWWENGTCYVTTKKYSATTSKIQTQLKDELAQKNIAYLEV